VQEVAANPSSIPARQSMISTAQSLVARFQNLSERLNDVRAGSKARSRTRSAISTYANEIAEMNHKITMAQQAGSAQPANDLLDTRDRLVKELNQLVRVSTTPASDGSVSVFIGTGQPLVVGTNATKLVAQASPSDPTRFDVNIITQSGGAITIPESLLGGGKLGGLLSMRSGSLDATQNQLGLIAVGLSTAFNAQHVLGQDLNGNLGTRFFTEPAVAVQRFSASTASPDVQFDDISKLSGDDYKLTFTNTTGGYSLTRVSDGASVTAAGIGLTITPAATSKVGDSFLILPTRYAAANIGVSITDTRMLAAAPAGQQGHDRQPRHRQHQRPGDIEHHGSGEFRHQRRAAQAHLLGGNLSGFPATLPVTYTPLNGSPVTLAAPVASIPYTSGMSISLGGALHAHRGHPGQRYFQHRPKYGRRFRQPQRRAARQPADHQDAAVRQRPALGHLPVGVFPAGQLGRQQGAGSASQPRRPGKPGQQATKAQQSVAGVNLDEEAANLIRYQQAYQASSKVMTIASKLFDEVLALGR
jgi:flagellar hook-associated protein 1 FlgK